MKTQSLSLLLALACALPSSLHAADDAAKALAADLVAKHGAALVSVEAVLEVQPKILKASEELRGHIPTPPKREQKTSSKGVVVDPSGIIAVPLITFNPMAILLKGREQSTPMGTFTVGADIACLSVTIIDAQGKEYDAKLVLQDVNSGLALVQLTEKPEADWPSVALPKEDKEPEAFAPVTLLNRLGSELDREIAVRRARYIQEIRAPGTFYELTGFVGAPGFAAFDDSSRFIGLGVMPLGIPPQDISMAGIVILPARSIAPMLEKVRSAAATK